MGIGQVRPGAALTPAALKDKGVPEMAEELDLYADMRIAVETIPEARSAIKKLRLRKKQLRQEKKLVNLAMKQIRAKHRDKLGGRTGRGFFGAIRKAGKATARANRDKELEPLQAQKLKIDDLLLQIDEAILKLEDFIEEEKLKD